MVAWLAERQKGHGQAYFRRVAGERKDGAPGKSHENIEGGVMSHENSITIKR
jgi:hypothetical protein